MSSDQKLYGDKIKRLATAEYSAFSQVFHQYYLALCFFAEKFVTDRSAAEDIVENLFIKLWEKQPDFNSYKNIKALLYIGVKNACVDHIRQRRSNLAKQNALSYLLKQESSDFILNEITRAEVIREVYAELQKLPIECRKVMQLYYQQGLDYKSISAQLGVTVSTVKNQKARGLKILKKRLGNSFSVFFLYIL